jgi:4-amino-4-deoxy-L-arabinose transferase-like glycosyltransferase
MKSMKEQAGGNGLLLHRVSAAPALPAPGAARASEASGTAHLRRLATPAVLLLLVALCLPVFTAERSQLNSDQSLYLAEALNIADGKGLVYSTGEPIVHRAPLYPAMLAAVIGVEGPSLEATYTVPRLAAVANVLLVFLLGRALFGAWGGAVAGVAAASSLYLRGLGTSLFLDGTQTAFLLAALLFYHRAESRGSTPSAAAAGVLLGVSFLVKEASVLLLPLPVVVMLLFGGSEGWKRRGIAWYGGFALAAGWWWVWVYAHTSEIFLVGLADEALGFAILSAGSIAFPVTVALLRWAPHRFAASRTTKVSAVALLLLWNAVFFMGLEASGWQYESAYLTNLASYMTTIFMANVQPAPLVIAAWVWLAACGLRSRSAALALLPALLYAAFFIHVADRGLSLRDQLPIVYLSYVALGGAAAWLIRTGSSFDFGRSVRAAGGAGAIAVGVALAAIVLLSGTSLSQPRTVTLQDDWHNQLSRETAAWLSANLEPGAAIMSSRLYYSHLYFLTDGAFPIHQLPTVEVVVGGDDPALRRVSTLFRWENHVMPGDSPDDRWLYLTRYPLKGYLIGLAENDLLEELRRRRIEYLVITSTDAGFSSPSLNLYFEDNPAFQLLHVISATPHDDARIYKVDLDSLGPQDKPALVTQSAREYMVSRMGQAFLADEYLERLSPAGFRVTAQ